MKEIVKSASKIVLLTMSLVLALSFLYVVLTNQIAGEAVADIFKISIGAVFGFYFAHKGDNTRPYAGK